MTPLPTGIVPILQTPFDADDSIDIASFTCLVEDAVTVGAAGLVFPAFASEVHSLRFDERSDLLTALTNQVAGRVPIIAGLTAAQAADSRMLAEQAASVGASGLLICPTPDVLASEDALIAYLRSMIGRIDLPVILQDLDWTGPGLAIETIRRITQTLPNVRGIKIETVPAGPKYSAIKDATQGRLHVSGGWAVTQMLDALERGVDALMPEASMVGVYRRIWDHYHRGNRQAASNLFDRIAPVLLFANQHIDVSIQFFKRVLHARGIFRTTRCRGIERPLDEVQAEYADRLAARVADLIDSLTQTNAGS